MIVNNSNLVLKQVNALFAKQLQSRSEEEDEIFKITEVVKSLNSTEEFLFFDALPGIEEWKDTINYDSFNSFSYTIKNKSWQFGVPIKREIIEDTKENKVLPQIEKFVGEASKNWNDFPSILINDLLRLNENAFDGAPFFANSRPLIEGSNAINNIIPGSGINIVQVYNDVLASINRLYSFKSKNNKAYNRGAKLIAYIPASLWSIFQTLKTASEINGIGSNTLKDVFEIIINFEQNIGNNDYYIINSNAVVKPFIYQIRKDPAFEVIDEKDSPYIKFLSTARANAGYGNPMSIVKVDN